MEASAIVCLPLRPHNWQQTPSSFSSSSMVASSSTHTELRHMRPRAIGLVPNLRANTKLSEVEKNAHMATRLRCKACPHIADNPTLPQASKEVLHPCAIEAMDIVIFLLGLT